MVHVILLIGYIFPSIRKHCTVSGSVLLCNPIYTFYKGNKSVRILLFLRTYLSILGVRVQRAKKKKVLRTGERTRVHIVRLACFSFPGFLFSRRAVYQRADFSIPFTTLVRSLLLWRMPGTTKWEMGSQRWNSISACFISTSL